MSSERKILVFVFFSYQYGTDIYKGIMHQVNELNLNWRVNIIREIHSMIASLRSMRPNDYDGIITCDFIHSNGHLPRASVRRLRAQMVEIIAGSRLPTVVIDASNHTSFHSETTAFVSIDNRQIAELAAKTLLDHGPYATYAYIGAKENPFWSLQRHHFFKAILAKRGIAVVSHGADCGTKELTSFLRRLPKPACLLAACDREAISALECCKSAGIRVPEDIAVLGVDNETISCIYAQPPLSSLIPDFEAEGRAAVNILNKMLSGKHPPLKPIICGIKGIAMRDSTKPASPDGRLVANADEFIRLNMSQHFTVDAIARHLKVSRRLLDLRYRQIKHQSVLEGIREQRLEEVAKLLKTTRISMGEIGSRCGFLSEAHLKTRFKARFGMSMRDFRKSTRGATK